MKAALLLLALALLGCSTPPPNAPAAPARDCPPLPTLPANPTAAQRGQHTEAIVVLYLRCAGIAH